MSSSGSGWPPGGVGASGRGGPYADDEYGADRGGDYYSEAGHDWSEPSGRPRGQSGPYGRDGADDPGRGYDTGSHSRRGYDHDPYSQDPYAHQEFGQDHSQGWQQSEEYGQGAGQGRYGWNGYDQGGYERDGRESFGQDPYGQEGYGQDRYRQEGYPQDGYRQDGYGQDGYPQDGYRQDGYPQDGYGQPGYGAGYYDQAPQSGNDYSRGGYRQDGPARDPYGHDPYSQDGYGSTDNYGGAGGYGQAGLGAAADPNAASGYRPDTGPFTRHDSGWYDSGSFRRADGYQSSGEQAQYGLPSGGYRRAELGAAEASGMDDGMLYGSGPASGHSVGYDQWHDAGDDGDHWDRGDSADHEDDWRDEQAGDSLLSRRFSRASEFQGRRVKRARRQRRVRGKFAFTAAILAGALVLGAVADFGYERFRAWENNRYGNYTGQGTGQVLFNVPQGAGLSGLGPALVTAGVIKALRPYDSAAAAAQGASGLQPGVYKLHHHMNAALVVTWLLSSAHRVNDQVTVIEGWRASNTAAVLAKKAGLSASEFLQIINHPAKLGLPSWAKGTTAEGFLFPDTYQVPPNASALRLLQAMVTDFNRRVAQVNLPAEARHVYTNPWHALIVASLIQAEAGHISDMPIISRVIWNRLLANMPLQLDSTVFYAMHKYGTYLKTQQEKNFASAYNTYLHAGLPPGPIDNPGLAAIQAAVHPSDGQNAHTWLYFITDTRPGHNDKLWYTASYTQFQQWQQQFQG